MKVLIIPNYKNSTKHNDKQSVDEEEEEKKMTEH